MRDAVTNGEKLKTCNCNEKTKQQFLRAGIKLWNSLSKGKGRFPLLCRLEIQNGCLAGKWLSQLILAEFSPEATGQLKGSDLQEVRHHDLMVCSSLKLFQSVK